MTTITINIPVSKQQAMLMQGHKELLEKIGADVVADYLEIQGDENISKVLSENEEFADLSTKLKAKAGDL